MDGESLIVGGTLFEGSTGQAWTYRRAGDAWEPTGTLRPADVAAGESFGRFGLLSDDLLFISALGHNESRGGIWVFRRDAAGGWAEEAKLTPADAQPQEFFGWSLAYDGERLITGAIQAGPQLQNRGAAYVFRNDGNGQWTQEARLSLGDAANPGDGFGSAVGWIDGMALVGAPGRDGGTGEVRTYAMQRGEWTPGVTLSAYDRAGGNAFGSAIATVGDQLWIGSPGADGDGRIYQLSYDDDAGSFGAARKVAGLDGDIGDAFGSTMTVGSGLAVVGAPGDDFGLGSAIVLAGGGDEWTATQKLLGPSPNALEALVGDDVTCEDGSADQFSCERTDILSFLPVTDIGGGRGAETNDVWGWTDPDNGREYAIVGRTDGTSFIDVTNPVNPRYLGNLPKTEGSRGNSWRDIKVYNNHAFVVADGAGNHGMQVFDLTRLRDVANPPMTFDEDLTVRRHRLGPQHRDQRRDRVRLRRRRQQWRGDVRRRSPHDRHPCSPRSAHGLRGVLLRITTTGNAGTGYSHDAHVPHLRRAGHRRTQARRSALAATRTRSPSPT